MTKTELGSKRQCQKCGAKFFDLNKDPIICPKCGTLFRYMAPRAQNAAARSEDGEEEAIAPAGVGLVSLDQVDAAEEKLVEPAADDIDVEDDNAPTVPFLLEEEDDDPAAALIDGGIATDEEP